MGHFARIDEDGIVRDVLVVANAAMNDLPFPESEPIGQEMLAQSGFVGVYAQCSYSASFRGFYPSIGYLFDGINFIPPITPEALSA
jgi:hypothetical protein